MAGDQSVLVKSYRKNLRHFTSGWKGEWPKFQLEKEDAGRASLEEEERIRADELYERVLAAALEKDVDTALEHLGEILRGEGVREGFFPGMSEEWLEKATMRSRKYRYVDTHGLEPRRHIEEVPSRLCLFPHAVAAVAYAAARSDPMRPEVVRSMALLIRELWVRRASLAGVLEISGAAVLRPMQYVWGLCHWVSAQEGRSAAAEGKGTAVPRTWAARSFISCAKDAIEAEGETVRVCSINMLADYLNMRYSLQFGSIPENGEDFVTFGTRLATLETEIGRITPDILCLQEVDTRRESDVRELVASCGLTGWAFAPRCDVAKGVNFMDDGCAIAWNPAKWTPIGEPKYLQTAEQWGDCEPVLAGVTMVALQKGEKKVVVVSTHVNPVRKSFHIRAVGEMALGWASELDASVIACGDWNGVEEEEIGAMGGIGLKASYDAVDSREVLCLEKDEEEITEVVEVESPLGEDFPNQVHLPSLDTPVEGLLSTSLHNTYHFGGRLDEIFYDSNKLQPVALLQLPALGCMYQGRQDAQHAVEALPSRFWCSDHVPVAADLKFISKP